MQIGSGLQTTTSMIDTIYDPMSSASLSRILLRREFMGFRVFPCIRISSTSESRVKARYLGSHVHVHAHGRPQTHHPTSGSNVDRFKKITKTLLGKFAVKCIGLLKIIPQLVYIAIHYLVKH